VPGTMKAIMENKKKISKETYGLSYEELKKYFERSKMEAAKKGIVLWNQKQKVKGN
jgi:hypothetical protein